MLAVTALQHATVAEGLNGTTLVIPAGWCGQGMAAWGLSCLSFSWSEKLPPLSGSWGGMEEGVIWGFTFTETEKQDRGMQGKNTSIQEGLRFAFRSSSKGNKIPLLLNILSTS